MRMGIRESFSPKVARCAMRDTARNSLQSPRILQLFYNNREMRPLHTKIIGIINITPDSFSDGGEFFDIDSAIEQAGKLIAEGADILDIGGESTRPYATPVKLEEELRRVIPVIKAIHKEYSEIPISIDTTKAEVAKQAIAAGASIINDISACMIDKNMVPLAAETGASVIIMHMQGRPKNMQDNPIYDDVVGELIDFFKKRITELTAAGIKKERIIIDPGIGFGKKLEHNLQLIKNLHRFAELHQPLLLAHSRKSFLGTITGIKQEQQRDTATAITTALAAAPWVDMVRVHNVAQTRQALLIAEAIMAA